MKRTDHPFFKKRHASKKALTQELARPRMTGLRQVWNPSTVADGLTPQRLAAILKAAEIGNHHEQLELAEVMEERDLHYGGLIATRRLAIQGVDVTVESHSESARDTELAEAVRDLVRRPEFDELVDDLTDAIGKGYSITVIDWTVGATMEPHYRWCDPRWFVFDQEDGRTLRLIDEANPTQGIELVPNRWIPHVPRIKSGLPSRSGLARLAAIAYMCKAWCLKDWMAFADTYGLPLRIGKYDPSATTEDIDTLVNAIANIASDAGAVIPDSMVVEFIETSRGNSGGDVMFEKLANYLDEQMSKRVLGHTGSSDSTPGKLGGEDQASEVRLDILRADAKQLAATLNRYLVKPYIDLNFGVQEHYPLLCLPVEEPEDTALLVDALEKLVPLGLEVEQSIIRDKLGLPDPEVDSSGLAKNKLLRPATPRSATPATDDDGSATEAALNQQADQNAQLDGLVDQLAASADGVFDGWANRLLDEIDRAIAEGESLESLQQRLLANYAKLDVKELAAVMGQAMSIAELAGRVDVNDGN